MSADRALNMINDMLWTAIMIGGPLLAAILIVGLLISIFQVATQIQEMTLSFVPKLVVAAGVLIALGPWMMSLMTNFATTLYLTIPALGSS